MKLIDSLYERVRVRALFVLVAALGTLSMLVSAPAGAANAWHERDLAWGAPATCFDGDTNLTHCPVTGYKVEVAGSCAAASWNVLATVGNVTSYHVTNLKPGSYCFRTRAITAGGDGDPAPTVPESKTVVTAPLPVKAGAPGATIVT